MEQILTAILIPVSIYLEVFGVTCARGLDFARSLHDQDVVTTVQGVSIATCKQKCEDRGRCKSAVYYRQAAYCVMTSTPTAAQTREPNSKAVLLNDINPDTETVDCGGSTCTPQETCKEAAPGSKACEILECPTLPLFYEKVSGNLYNVGNRLIARGSPQDMRVTCGQDGRWVPDSLHDVHDCTDMFGDSGVYTMGTTSHQVYCDMDTDEGHWLVFQRRQDGSENFLRNWIDYQNGFGSLVGEFWLGLEMIRQLVIYGDYELRVDLEDFNGETRFAKYSTFSIGDETDLYSLSVTGYSGTAGDSFSGHSGYNFSTIDNDNDACLIEGCSCAVYYKGGWWYSACHSSNLNGLYFHGGQNTTQYANHVHWSIWHGYWISLKRTEMKIRRKWTG